MHAGLCINFRLFPLDKGSKLGGQLVARRGVFNSLAFLSEAHTYYARPVNMKLAVHEFCKRAQTPFNSALTGYQCAFSCS